MRKKQAQINDISQIEAILEKAPVMRLGLAGADGWPYIVPLTFAYEPGCIYWHSGPKGKKMELLAENSQVCFEVEQDVQVVQGPEPCKWGWSYSSVIGQGRAVIVEDQEEKIQALNAMMKKHAGREFEFPSETMRRTVVVRIDIQSMTGRREGAA